MWLKTVRHRTMIDKHTGQPFYSGIIYRLLSAAFGSFLVAVGFYALFFAETHVVVRITGGVAIIMVGLNMVWSAYTAKESWVSKIGPLP